MRPWQKCYGALHFYVLGYFLPLMFNRCDSLSQYCFIVLMRYWKIHVLFVHCE